MQQSRLRLKFAGQSFTGVRDENQDAFVVKSPEDNAELVHKGIVACIADGVSCSENSQKASHTAAMQFLSDYYATPESWSTKHSVGKILTSLNTWLFEEGAKQALSHNGLVTTFSSVIFKSNTAHLFHVGDSRIYRMRKSRMRQLTRDHQRTNFGKGAYLTRALGMDNKLEVDYQTVPLKEGDVYILTTDGVHDFIEDERLSQMVSVSRDLDLEEVSREICNQALANGSQDNVSCLILEVTELPQKSLLEHQHQSFARSIPPALEVNQKLDDYRVNQILYAGSRSHVYKVTEESTGNERVMKVPSVQYSDDPEHLIHFSNEFWVGSQLNSSRVMKIYPVPADTRFNYQLCEYIEGITLRQWMYDNPSPELQSVRKIVDEVIKAVRVFQRADMVHRDLKPENIMITEDGGVKIIDLGSVKVRGLEEITEESRDAIPLGALNYIAPEYINTGVATTVSDLFSVAVICYEMLTGELPYKPASNQNLQSARHTKWTYRPLTRFRDDIPEWVDLTLKKATHHLPARRYDVLSEFVSDLFTPNKGLQNELKESPLLQRNPVLFWKSVAIFASLVAVTEALLLLN